MVFGIMAIKEHRRSFYDWPNVTVPCKPGAVKSIAVVSRDLCDRVLQHRSVTVTLRGEWMIILAQSAGKLRDL
jgi:hypothetical protein